MMRRERRTIKTPARFDDADFYSSAIIGIRASSHLFSTSIQQSTSSQSSAASKSPKQPSPKNPSNDHRQSRAKKKSSESQFYPAPITASDVTSSALLIDRMISHLTKECENMNEWIQLKKQRLEMEKLRREQEAELELKREKLLLDGMARMQQQMFEFMTKFEKRETQRPRDDISSPQKHQLKSSAKPRNIPMQAYESNHFNRKSNVVDRSKVKTAISKSDNLSSYHP